MALIESVNNAVSSVVWGLPMMGLLILSGLYLSVVTGFVQFRHFGHAMGHILGKLFQKQKAGAGTVTPFQAVTTALAATIGTGNIAGVTSAVTLGGPGAIFWLWAASLVGMCTKYAEVVLAVRYRRRSAAGDFVGGPMYYITEGLGKSWGWLSALFCLFGALAAFGIGNAVQVGNITSSVNTAIAAFSPAPHSAVLVNWIVGIATALITGLVILGGIKRIGRVTEALVPLMSVIYIVFCLAVIIANFQRLGEIFRLIFQTAFRPEALAGGGAGITFKAAVSWGVKRGVFSNEAGLGSAPIAHAAADTNSPVQQGFYGIFEVFVDSILICTLTGVALLISGVPLDYGSPGTTALNAAAFATVFGERTSSLILALGVALFAVCTLFGWALYGTRCCEYLLGARSIRPYQTVFVLVILVGATMDLDLAWNISDTLNGLMAIPNLIALIALAGTVSRLTRQYFKSGKRR